MDPSIDLCPWCLKELDAEEFYRDGDLNDLGYYECPACGGQFSVIEYVEYSYEIAIGPSTVLFASDDPKDGEK